MRLRVIRASEPITGYQETPTPTLNSIATMKLSVSSSNGAIGEAVSSASHDVLATRNTIMITVMTASPGAMIALKRPIVTGPRESTHQAIAIAMRPPIVTTGPYWPRSAPATVEATWLVARPAMTASSDDQPISVKRMIVKTIAPTPTTPNAPRSSMYCSEP